MTKQLCFSKYSTASFLIAFALTSCTDSSFSHSSRNSSNTNLEACDSKIQELEVKIDELNTELEETKTKLREAEMELFEFDGFKYTKSYNGVITHYYEDIRAAFDRAEEDIKDLEEENSELRNKLMHCH